MTETEEKPLQRTGMYTIRRILMPYLADRAVGGCYSLWMKEDMERHLAERIRQCQMDGRPYVTSVSPWQIGYHPRFGVGRLTSPSAEEEGWHVYEREPLQDGVFKPRDEGQRPANYCEIRCVCVLLRPEDAEVGEYIYPPDSWPKIHRVVMPVSELTDATPETAMLPDWRVVGKKEFEYVPSWAWQRVR